MDQINQWAVTGEEKMDFTKKSLKKALVALSEDESFIEYLF